MRFLEKDKESFSFLLSLVFGEHDGYGLLASPYLSGVSVMDRNRWPFFQNNAELFESRMIISAKVVFS